MSVHQIIYTSCMRGIRGVNDGQQIFSYDVRFKDFDNDAVKRLFTYQPPALEPGMIMTEEVAATLPQAFIFRKLENGKCALALSTYLGRDYMGSAGRFGNHLSHVVVADEGEIGCYPCEFYGGSLLRDHMEYEEVNNPDPPDFLPEPVLEKGYRVDVDSVSEFLSIGGRLDIYKNMLYAMLAFERERKRVVICDTPENIIMWIAALEYALPLKLALGINFTTYEFDPSLSESQICGVVQRGTRYTAEGGRLYFVFDIYGNDCAEFDKDSEFYDFIDTAFSLSFGSLQDFHAFLMKGYTYEKADEELYSAYALYSLLSDGIKGMTGRRMELALSFADKYAVPSEKIRIAKNVLSQYEGILAAEKRVFLTGMQYVLSMKNIESGQVRARNLIVDRVLRELSDSDATEAAFMSFYDDTEKLSGRFEFDLVAELMREKNREKLFSLMQDDVETWEIAFIVRVISAYVKENQIQISELTQDKPWGYTYYRILVAVYAKNHGNGFFLVTCILNEFSENGSYLTNMALNMEGMLLELPGGERETAALWQFYGQKMAVMREDSFSAAYDIFAHYERYEEIYGLIELQLRGAADIAAAKREFDIHFDRFVRRNRTYASRYGKRLLLLYFNKLREFDGKQSKEAERALFDLLVDGRVDIEFADELIQDLLKFVPYKSPSEEDEKLVENAFEYSYNFRRQRITGKLLLLVIGMGIEGISDRRQAEEKMEQLGILTKNNRADLAKLSEVSVRNYFSWVLPIACTVFHAKEDMQFFYSLFDMPLAVEREFFSQCTKAYLRQCRDEKDYDSFAEYFGFVCECGGISAREEVGKAFRRMNKIRMAELDQAVHKKFYKDKRAIGYWEDVKAAAETANPLLSNINKLFGKWKK